MAYREDDMPGDDAPIITVAPVTRQGMKLLISLFGMSETGKTMSALRLACGIEPDPAKRGLLDTEGGERGRAYVDAIPGGYQYGALTAPFTPERYMAALQAFVRAGVTTLVVDSVSHAWFAAGGVLDMVENATERNDLAKWAKPKRRLGKLTGQWLGCGLHLILCARGKQPLIEVPNPDKPGKKMLVLGTVVPVQDKTLRFDMTIVGLMKGDGLFSVDRAEGGKCPGPLRPIFGAGEVMDETMGKALIDWIGGQDATTGLERALMLDATAAAEGGVEAFRAWHKDQPTGAKAFLKPKLGNYQSIAKAADADKARVAEEAANQAREARNDPSDPFAAPARQPEPEADHETASKAYTVLATALGQVATPAALVEMLAHADTKTLLARIMAHEDLRSGWLSLLSDKQDDLRIGAAA